MTSEVPRGGEGEEQGAYEEVEVEEEDEEQVEYEEVEEEEAAEEEQEGDAQAQPAVAEAPEAPVRPSEPSSTTTAGPSPAAPAHAAPDASHDLDLKAIEAQATKVAKDVQNAAMEMSTKLSAGFKSALGSLGTDNSSLTKMAGGLASWWGSLDPPSQPKRNEMQERIQASSKTTTELQDLFGLSAEENLVETFKCKLIQTYACSHNSFTPAIQMAFQGTLYITDMHTCFSVEERNRKVPFKVLHSEVTKAVRHRPLRKGDLSDILRLDLATGDLGQPQFLQFKDFDSGSVLDSALALVEHLMGGS